MNTPTPGPAVSSAPRAGKDEPQQVAGVLAEWIVEYVPNGSDVECDEYVYLGRYHSNFSRLAVRRVF